MTHTTDTPGHAAPGDEGRETRVSDTVTIPRYVAETLCEALDLVDNPYHGAEAEEVAAWADYIHARDSLNAYTYPNGSMANDLRVAGWDIPQEDPDA